MKAPRVLAALVALWTLPTLGLAAEAEPAAPSETAAETPSYPSLEVLGFTDAGFSYLAEAAPGPSSGFFQGQFVLHFSSALSSRITFFGEVSITTGGGSSYGYGGSTSGETHATRSAANAELHRSVLKYTHSDALKLSIGRFHTPITYWNVAFHHGQWLQTTVTRPVMLDFSNPLLPLHFIGAFAEGKVPSGRANLSYLAGIGNGRAGGPGRPEEVGDANDHRAWLVRLSARPEWVPGLEVGAAVHEDRVAVQYTRSRADFDERIWNAYAALTKEKPELIAEYVSVRHRRIGAAGAFTSHAAYVQAAWRVASRVKPYARWEEIRLDEDDHALGLAKTARGVLLGVRLDAADFVAVKAEVQARNDEGAPFERAIFGQVSLTF